MPVSLVFLFSPAHLKSGLPQRYLGLMTAIHYMTRGFPHRGPDAVIRRSATVWLEGARS